MSSRPLFLATTALEEFWDRTQEIVFLGYWCLSADRHDITTSPTPHVMPSPWDDRERFYRAASYVEGCSEALLRQLSGYLNGIHRTDYSERYWRIVLGPWLILYSHIIYDRFVLLQSALDKYSGLQTIVMHESSFRTPSDFTEAEGFAASDAYNLQIFSQLLKLMGLSFTSKRYNESFGSNPQTSSRAWALSFAEKLIRLPFEARATVTIRKTNLSPFEAWKLAWATRFRALPLDFSFERRFDRTPAIFNEDRLGLGKLPCDDPFQRILRALLPSHFPTLYLEGYQVAHARIAKTRQTPIVISGYAWYGDEGFTFYAAHAAAKGSQLVAVQHGGAYGAYRSAPYEAHERRMADFFFAWGWAGEQMPKCGNIVNPRFPQLQHQVRRRTPGNTVLFIATGQPRYLYRFHSCPVGSQWEDYFDWQHRFLTHIPDKLRSFVCFRPYPAPYGHTGELRVRRSFPSISWDDSRRFAYEKLVKARIVVIDHLGTVLLEALAANVPTILFWDPNRWEARPEVQTHLEQLRQAQILWDSPEGAAEKLAEAYVEPGRWWNTDDVQSARREFVIYQAFTKQDWISNWIDNLRKISKGCGGGLG